MKKTVFAALVVAIVSVFVSCGYKSQVAPIDGSDYSTFTAKVDNRILKGVQNAAGEQIKEPVYQEVAYDHGFFIGTYPSYREYDLFTADGKDILPELVKTICVYSENAADSLGHFVIQTGSDSNVMNYWYFPDLNKVIGPQECMYLYPTEGYVLYEKAGKIGVLTYDNKDLIEPSSRLVLAVRKDVKKVKNGKKTVRENVETPVIYTADKDNNDWKKFSGVTGESLGELDAQDADLINKSGDTMLDNVYAVREKK
uniref:Lipoprotein n=1 Tax=uncultured Alphaproteobacteria bacterium TaxID=91750 RepID=A0A6G8F2X7_9PROT|nr:hypothetical protein PlAlph_4100 [uncultured Alphaproteobacteria bacterium]